MILIYPEFLGKLLLTTKGTPEARAFSQQVARKIKRCL
jgi:hypothetical protein